MVIICYVWSHILFFNAETVGFITEDRKTEKFTKKTSCFDLFYK